ncbi:hypothetical protein FRC00_001500 [Tulasnella sp. 408]|nr:hypothetical protein FRC00_001500 [Tulasnella sp. 408]
MTFLAIQNLDPTDENEKFETSLSIAGKITSATITEAFRVQQTRRDIASQTKESSLTARTGRPRREPKPGSDTCIWCKKAHKSDDCFTNIVTETLVTIAAPSITIKNEACPHLRQTSSQEIARRARRSPH